MVNTRKVRRTVLGLGCVLGEVHGGTGAEKRRAGTNFRGALFDGDFEIMAHAHGKRRKRARKISAELVAKRSKLAEEWPHALRVLEERRNGHESLQMKVRERGDTFGDCGQVGFGDSAFCGFVAEMHLNEHAALFSFSSGGGIEPLRQRQTIHRVDAIEQASRPRGFVALQVADQVPNGIEIRNCRRFIFELLDAILAKMAQASAKGFDDGAGRMSFRYRNNCDFLGLTSSALRGASDALTNPRKILGNRRYSACHFLILACCSTRFRGRSAGAGGSSWLTCKQAGIAGNAPRRVGSSPISNVDSIISTATQAEADCMTLYQGPASLVVRAV
jgi:hypothetical protein